MTGAVAVADLLTLVSDPLVTAGRVLSLAILSGLVAAGTAVAYRWYAREILPTRLGVLVGLSAVALVLNSVAALSQFIDPVSHALTLATAIRNVAAFVAAGVAADAGRRIGDRIAVGSSAIVGARSIEGDLSPIVRAVGRVIAVELPEHVEDIDGYDPVSDDVKETLAGRTLLFPRGLTVAELHERFVDRLKEDYGVGHVDVDLAADGTVEYLALGGRVAGLGPTLPPETVAVALRADPANGASPGDAVQVWAVEGEPERVATGELRGTADDVVTLAVDEAEADAFDSERSYRLVTLTAGSRPDREFAALLRTADETMGTVTVAGSAALVGREVRTVEATVVAIRTPDDGLEPIPSRRRTVAAGETLYVLARPDALRRLETEAQAPASQSDPHTHSESGIDARASGSNP